MTILSGLQQSTPGKGGTQLRNSATPAQAVSAATATLITGSTIVIPNEGLQAGQVYRAKINLTKTAAGTATDAFVVGFSAYGEAVTAATVGTGALLSFTKPAGTAAADTGEVTIELFILAVGAAEAGSVKGTFKQIHSLTATGLSTNPTDVIFALDASTATVTTQAVSAGGTLGVVVTTGAAEVRTINTVEASLDIPA